MGWIGVDLDGTLAHYESGQFPKIGEPIKPMLDRVYEWIESGEEVRICTARAAIGDEAIEAIRDWLAPLGLDHLEITCKKDPDMEELWDDKAVQVIPNTGQPITGDQSLQESMAKSLDLTYHEEKKRKRKLSDPNSFELMQSFEHDPHCKVYGEDMHQGGFELFRRLETEED